MNRCYGITQAGERCKITTDSQYCHFHQKLYKTPKKPGTRRPVSPVSPSMLTPISPEPLSPLRAKPALGKINVFRKRAKIIYQLRYDPKLIPVMDINGFVPIKSVNMQGLSPRDIGKEIELITDHQGNHYVRALYGWTGAVALHVMRGKFVPYSGKHNIFCMSHVSTRGLGELNQSRVVNVLEVPERCENKGIRAFVNVAEARKNGIEFWAKVGDRYGNKIYCFDPTLNLNFFKLEYHDKYGTKEFLEKAHAETIELYSKLMKGSRERALTQAKKLFITEEEESD